MTANELSLNSWFKDISDMADNKLSDYWLADKNTDLENLFNLMNLQQAVANFVKIISGREIAVEFQHKGEKSSADKIVISSDLQEIDSTVGIAIHETLTFLYSYKWCRSRLVGLVNDEYLVGKKLQNINYSSLTPGERTKCKNHVRFEMEQILDLVEYWRLDDFAIRTSPGYKGYVLSAYSKYFNPDYTITLQNTCREKLDRGSFLLLLFSQIAYSFLFEEIIHFKVELPEHSEKKIFFFHQIRDLVDINNISRLKDSEDSLKLAVEIWELLDSCTPQLPDTQIEEGVEELIDQLFNIASLNISKKDISTQRKEELKTLYANSSPSEYYADFDNRKVRIVVLDDFTKDIIYNGRYPFFQTKEIHATEKAVSEGLALGKQLGRKLAFRNDSRETQYSRQKHGKIERRLLHSLAYNNEYIFYRSEIEKYTDLNLHISIDGSHSMTGTKFLLSLKTTVAIAQAAALLKNVNVTITFRYHMILNNAQLPLLLIAYNSRKDHLNKIRQLFCFLKAVGPTPEGLCFGALTDLITSNDGESEEHFLINLSDGMPCFIIEEDKCVYEDQPAIDHTRDEVLKMKQKDIRILSYYIISEKWRLKEVEQNFTMFKYMYGKNAELINLEALGELAQSLNQFIMKQNAKKIN